VILKYFDKRVCLGLAQEIISFYSKQNLKMIFNQARYKSKTREQNAGTIVLLNNYGTKGSFLSLFLLKLQVFCYLQEIKRVPNSF